MAAEGTARGGADAPAFIFGKRNLAFKPASGGGGVGGQGRDAAAASLVDDLKAKFPDASPEELQDRARKKLMKQVRGRMLVKMMQANGGKPPTREAFQDAMHKWQTAHLDAAMAAVNKALGTTGSGIEKGEFAGQDDTRAERRQGQRNFREATREAEEYIRRARKSLVELRGAEWSVKADEIVLDSPEANAKREKELAGKLRAFFTRQQKALAQAVRDAGEHLTKKPKDVSRWWNQKAWDAELEAILRPYATTLATETYAKVAAEMKPHGKSAKATLAEVLPELTSGLGTRITGINEHTRESVYKQIEEGIRYGEGPSTIADRLEDAGIFGEYRSELVARTETMHALNDAALGSYVEYGVQQVEAVDGDEDEACATRNGQVFTVDEAKNITDHPNGTLSWNPVLPPAGVTAPTPTAVEVTYEKKYQLRYDEAWEKDPRITDAMRSDLDAAAKRLLSDADINVRAPHQVLEKILGDGRFKSQFETSSSRGALNTAYRANEERQLFAYADDLPIQERPIYGYVTDGGVGVENPLFNEIHEGAGQYGELIFRMKNGLRNRTTVTYGDSLGTGYTPVELSQPTGRFFSDGWRNAYRRGDYTTDDVHSLYDLGYGRGYREAQIHGGVSLSDVDLVLLPRNMDAQRLREVQRALDRAGIRWELYG